VTEGTNPAQLRHHADRSEAAGRHGTKVICRQAADEIERLRCLVQSLEEERKSGMITTFMGIPVDEAARIIQREKADPR